MDVSEENRLHSFCGAKRVDVFAGEANEINPLMPAGISHGETIFHTRSVFHKSRKGFISLKKPHPDG